MVSPHLSLLFAALIASSAMAAAPAKKMTEGPSDIIEKAYNLSLQKDRTQAVNVLVSAIRRENPSSPTAKELRATLQDVGGRFFGDKAQQLYELALSLRSTDLSQAQAKLAEALRIEPDNAQLVSESARLQILKGDCAAASETTAKSRKWNPYDEQVLLSAGQAAVCQGDWPLYISLRSQADSKKGSFASSWLVLDIEKSLQEKADARAKENIESLKKMDPVYPEIPYWFWKIETDKNKKLSWAQRYVMGCKSLSAAQYRRYNSEPTLCRRLADVESFLKATGAP